MNKKQARSNAIKIRLKLLAEKKRKAQDEKEERLLARWILFCKGRGQTKNLNAKDKAFLLMVEHKAYDRYMSDLTLGTKLRVQKRKFAMSKWTPARPPSFGTYRRIWYGAAKRNYLIHDVPKLMKLKWEALKNGSADSQMQKLGGRNMQELIREVSERERGNVDIPVPDVPVHSGSVEGRNQGQKQLRERRKKTPAGNRDAAEVGA